MKVEIKIYKIFDPDLYAMSAYGIKITNLMKEALEHYVRGEYVHFHIPKSLIYDFSLKKRSVHLAMDITDPESIAFLKKNIKPRYRTAFLKSLLRGSFTTPQLGAFLSNEESNRKDTKMIKFTEFETLPNLKELTVSQNPRRIYDAPPKPKDEEKKEKQQKLVDELKGNEAQTDIVDDKPQVRQEKPSEVYVEKDLEESTQQKSDAPTSPQERNPQEQEKNIHKKNKKKKKKEKKPQTQPLEDKFGIVVNPTQQTPTPPAHETEFKLEEEKDPQDSELVLEDVNVVEDNNDDSNDDSTFKGFDSLINNF